MSVVAVPGAAAYGPQQLCGGGATRKRKDVVQLEAEEDHQEDTRGRGDHDFFLAAPHHHGGLFVLERVDEEEEEEEQERSSIGAASDEEEEEAAGEEADSAAATRRRTKHDALACMDALDDALPIKYKRGLSNFFSGKSRSFANLQDAAITGCAQHLAKPENPFNKRRRVLRCCSIRRVASTPLTELPPFLPPPPPPAAGDNGRN